MASQSMPSRGHRSSTFLLQHLQPLLGALLNALLNALLLLLMVQHQALLLPRAPAMPASH